MGLTPDQKIDLAIAYIKQCDDLLLLFEMEDILYMQISKLLKRVENENIPE